MNVKVRDLELRNDMTVTELIDAFGLVSFNARKVSHAARIWTDAVNCGSRVYFTLSGALVPAGMRRIVARCIEKKAVHVIITTGANMVHDILQSDMAHEIGDEFADDGELLKRNVMRIYDTFLPNDKWDSLDRWLETELYPSIARKRSTAIVTPSEVFARIGMILSDNGDNGILASAYLKGVPVLCPAFTDCDLGIVLHHANTGILKKNRSKIIIDQISDFTKLVEDVERNSPRCAVMVGGGTPKNYLLQSGISIREKDKCGFDYAIQLTTDSPQWGGLSGATLAEAVSWGKVRDIRKSAVVYSDATITLPLVATSVLANIDTTKKR